MHPLIEQHRESIAALCRQYHVRRLQVFGSAARGEDFDTERSDVDFLVEFECDKGVPKLSTYFDLQAELEKVVGRHVDLMMAGSVRNPYVRADIERSLEDVYAS